MTEIKNGGNKIKVEFIYVNYESEKYLIKSLQSINQYILPYLSNFDVKITIVENCRYEFPSKEHVKLRESLLNTIKTLPKAIESQYYTLPNNIVWQ